LSSCIQTSLPCTARKDCVGVCFMWNPDL